MTIDRLFISHQYIRGKGIEIGAWHNPFPLNPQMQVTYVDRYPYEELIKMRDNDPAIQGKAISRVDVVDDGMWLKKFDNESQDFVLSSHQLEHCWDPLETLFQHLRVVKRGGKVFYAVPDKRFTFDSNRPVSLLSDIHSVFHDENADAILENQYVEYRTIVDKVSREIARAEAKEKDLRTVDIHWFTWDAETLSYMLTSTPFDNHFEIELFSRAGHENFVVLRKL